MRLAGAFLVWACCLPAAAAQDWPRFRGPNGSGLGEVKGFAPRWTEKDHAWKVKLPGVGHSSPVVYGERLFVTCGEEKTGKRILVCVRGRDGQQLWTREFASTPHGKHGSKLRTARMMSIPLKWSGPFSSKMGVFWTASSYGPGVP